MISKPFDPGLKNTSRSGSVHYLDQFTHLAERRREALKNYDRVDLVCQRAFKETELQACWYMLAFFAFASCEQGMVASVTD